MPKAKDIVDRLEAVATGSCEHSDYVFNYAIREHVCEGCRLRWRDTGRSVETDNYIFDRLLGSSW